MVCAMDRCLFRQEGASITTHNIQTSYHTGSGATLLNARATQFRQQANGIMRNNKAMPRNTAMMNSEADPEMNRRI